MVKEEILLTRTGDTDDWSRPIYKDQKGRIFVDNEMNDENPDIHVITTEGEPLYRLKNYKIVGKEETKFAKGGEIEVGVKIWVWDNNTADEAIVIDTHYLQSKKLIGVQYSHSNVKEYVPIKKVELIGVVKIEVGKSYFDKDKNENVIVERIDGDRIYVRREDDSAILGKMPTYWLRKEDLFPKKFANGGEVDNYKNNLAKIDVISFPNTMPQKVKDIILGWEYVSKSPFSDSYYNCKGKDWDNTPNGCIRIADHWNFITIKKERDFDGSLIQQHQSHAQTDIDTKDNLYWSVGKYDLEKGIYNIIGEYPFTEPFFTKNKNEIDFSKKIQKANKENDEWKYNLSEKNIGEIVLLKDDTTYRKTYTNPINFENELYIITGLKDDYVNVQRINGFPAGFRFNKNRIYSYNIVKQYNAIPNDIELLIDLLNYKIYRNNRGISYNSLNGLISDLYFKYRYYDGISDDAPEIVKQIKEKQNYFYENHYDNWEERLTNYINKLPEKQKKEIIKLSLSTEEGDGVKSIDYSPLHDDLEIYEKNPKIFLKNLIKLKQGGEVYNYKNNLAKVDVIFSNPKFNYSTNVNSELTEKEARDYFVGNIFNVGSFPKEQMEDVIDIKFYPKGTYANGGIIEGELEGAKRKLAAVEKKQQLMKDVNVIIRSKTDVDNKLKALGLSDDTVYKVQQPDYAGRVGFATYQLTNNNANMKRLQDRVKMLEGKMQGFKDSVNLEEEKYVFDGGEIEVNYPIDRVQILFPNGRTDKETYSTLRKNGWVYSPSNKAFQRKITPQAIRNAVQLFKATKVSGEQNITELVKIEEMDNSVNLKTEIIEWLENNGVDTDKLKFRYSEKSVYQKARYNNESVESEVWIHEKDTTVKLGLVLTRSEFEKYKKLGDEGVDFLIYGNNLPLKTITTEPQKSDYEKELERQLEQGLVKDNSSGISILGMTEGKNNPVDKLIKEQQKEPTKLSITAYNNPYEVNRAIESIIDKKGDDRSLYSSDEIEFIGYYSGYGGLEKFGATGKGLLYEYFTPTDICKKMWALAYKYGYGTIGDNSVLETSVGTGNFLKYAPNDVNIDAYEINTYSQRICKLLYPHAEVILQPFEKNFIKNNLSIKNKIQDLPQYSLAISNPPYGKIGGLYMGMGEAKYTNASNYTEYFIFRGLDMLVSGGLLIFIVGAEQKNGGTLFLDSGNSKIKQAIFEKADLLDAYRLPINIFERTGVSSEILVFKKR